MSEEKKKPEIKFKARPITATVWKNECEHNGEINHYFTVSLARTYKNKEGEFKTTNNLRVIDIPKANFVLNKCYEFLIEEKYNETNFETPSVNVSEEKVEGQNEQQN